jgi:2-methylcitrate dehydratase PrpD
MDTVSQKLGEYIAKSQFEDLTTEALAAAKRSTLDTLGAMVAGSTAPGIDTVVGLAKGWKGKPEAHVLGFGYKVPAPLSAWCNGTMARAHEIDDCVDFLPVHPSASAVPALFTLAELKGGLSGRDFLTALAVGQDMMIRLGLAVRQNAMQSGRNNMFKIFGPTAALARAMGFDSEQAQNALGISFSFAVGDGQCALDGALTLRLQQGIVAQGALLSVILASKGFTGARDFLLGKFGYLRAFEPDPRMEYLTEGLGRTFYGERISIKPFSSCRATHPAIDLALQLRKENGIDPKSVRKVTVRTCPEVHQLVASPRDAKIKPDSTPSAQFSIQYTVAAALQRGDVFLKEIDSESLKNTDILDLAQRVYVESEPSLRTDFVLGRTIMEIELECKLSLKREIDLPLGNPSRPMGFDAIAEKFLKCASYSVRRLEKSRLKELIQAISRLEDLPDVSLLISYLF